METITLYHGTRRAEEILRQGFRPSTGGEFGPGIYLTDSPHTAAFYAQRVARGEGPPVVLETVVRLRRPFTVRKVDWIRKTERRTPRTVQSVLRRQGHDAIVGIALNDRERQFIVFDSGAIVGPTRIVGVDGFGVVRSDARESRHARRDVGCHPLALDRGLPRGGTLEAGRGACVLGCGSHTGPTHRSA